MFEIEIDGKKISVAPGTSIIEAADQHGIYIPRFCYHKKLSVAANCRMCLVEVDKVNKPLPACATPVSDAMKVRTKSAMALKAQRAVMEFLLINHPLDCPICDQGGECELQDTSLGYGFDHSQYLQSKRSIFDEDLGPLIDTNMTRCIQCTRCVRFGDEIVGLRELGVLDRGEDTQIGTYVKHMVKAELSGNIIDLCPVGALTSKPYRYSARPWELLERPGIAPHDCVGSNIFIHSRRQEYVPQREIMRVVPRENEAVNEIWLSNRDRFSYLALSHSDRLLHPRIKVAGKWKELTWTEALPNLADKLLMLRNDLGVNEIAGLISPNASLEECYLFQKCLRWLGTPHIDHRVRQLDFNDQNSFPASPGIGMPITEMANLQNIFLLGSDLQNEAPILALQVKKAVKKGASVLLMHPRDESYPFPITQKLITTDFITHLAQMVVLLAHEKGESHAALQHIKANDQAKSWVAQLKDAGNSGLILLGDFALNHPRGEIIRTLANLISQYTGVKLGFVTEGPNTAGAWVAGAVPHRGPAAMSLEHAGQHAKALLTTERKQVYFLWGLELEYDCAYSGQAIAALEKAEFVVCFTPFITQKMLQYADLILPLAPFTETNGSFINAAGDCQSFNASTPPFGEAKPGWKILQALAQLMGATDFNYQHSREILEEITEKVNHMPAVSQVRPRFLPPHLPKDQDDLQRYAPWPIYRADALCRRANALQESIAADIASISLHSELAASLKLEEGDNLRVKQNGQQITLPFILDDSLASNLVLIPSGLEETAAFGESMAAVSLERVGKHV